MNNKLAVTAAPPINIELKIGGLVPLTTIDFPDHLAAVIFCQGCPWRCYYCHNPRLLAHSSEEQLIDPWPKILKFLQARVGLLEAVVFSGGEPTLQPQLLEAVQIVKQLGFKIGLHTAGIYPERLAKLLPYLAWVGMDLKAPFDQYATITRVPRSGKRALESVKLILASKIAYEFRTTVHPKLLDLDQLAKIKANLVALGADLANYKIQQFRSEGCIEQELIT